MARTILMHGVAPQCAVKGSRPSLGGEAGVAPSASSRSGGSPSRLRRLLERHRLKLQWDNQIVIPALARHINNSA